jgi:signal transduction histidine kinase
MPQLFRLEWFIPPSLRRDDENFRRSLLLVFITSMLPLWGPVFSIAFGVSGSPWFVTLAPSFFGALGFLVPFALRRSGSLLLAGNLFVGIFVADLTFFCWFEGGFDSPGLPWMFIIPMIVTYVAGIRSGLFWTGVVVAEIVGFYVLGDRGWLPPARDSAGVIRLLRMVDSAAVSVSMLLLVRFNEHVRDRLNLTIVRQQLELTNSARMAALGEMSGGVAHEINNPLAASS